MLAVACALTTFLARSGRVRLVSDRPRPLCALVAIAPLCGISLAGLGSGTLLLVDSLFRLPPDDPAVPGLAYAGGHALAAGASAAVTLVLVALLYQVDLDPGPGRPDGAPAPPHERCSQGPAAGAAAIAARVAGATVTSGRFRRGRPSGRG